MEEQLLFGVTQGWQCPICKRVYAPFVQKCFYCGEKETQTIQTITSTNIYELPQEQKK